LWKRQDVPRKTKIKHKKSMRKIIDGNETLGMIKKRKRLKNLKKVMVVENVGIESRCKMNYY
jgi:hypothetical protein